MVTFVFQFEFTFTNLSVTYLQTSPQWRGRHPEATDEVAPSARIVGVVLDCGQGEDHEEAAQTVYEALVEDEAVLDAFLQRYALCYDDHDKQVRCHTNEAHCRVDVGYGLLELKQR